MKVYFPHRFVHTEGDIVYNVQECGAVELWKAFPILSLKIDVFSKCFLSRKRCERYCTKQMRKENKKGDKI